VRRAGGAALVLLLALAGGARSQTDVVALSPDRDESTIEVLREALAEGTRAIASDGVGRTLQVETHWPPRSPRAEALADELREAAGDALREAGAAADGGAELVLELSADDRELRVALVPREAEVSWWRAFFFQPARARRWRVPLDAELRTFVDRRPSASRSALRVSSARLPDGDYLAVGTARAAGEPPLLLLVGEDSVSAFRLNEGRRRTQAALVARAERPAGSAPGIAARRAFATLSVEGPAAFVQWRDRVEGYRLRWAPLRLEVVGDRECPELAHRWPDACAEPVDGRDYFASALLPREGRPAPRTAPSSFYARWRGAVRRSDGSVADVEVVVNPRGRLVASTDGREIGLQGHGAALGAGDIDADGLVELLVSGPEQGGDRDTLGLLRLQADGGLRRLWSQEVPGRVFVAGAGDLDGDGVPTLFAVADEGGRSTLWIVGGPR
jgi:hypothetical protein